MSMIKVDVSHTFYLKAGKEYILLLNGVNDKRTLPVGIGKLEAQAIAFHINGVQFPRPLTHDLFKNLLGLLNYDVAKAEIFALIDDTFYAHLVIKRDNQTYELDSRPSDAIAIAMRCNAPIFVDESVMEKAGIIIEEEVHNENDDLQYETAAIKHTEMSNGQVTPLEALNRELKNAIHDERYEDAAVIRDEISKLSNQN